MLRYNLIRKIIFLLQSLLAVFLTVSVMPTTATEVWTGPMFTFNKPNGADASQPVNQDRITPNVWLTRDTTRGLYNIADETYYTHFFSPSDTEWAYGLLNDYDSLAYANWETWNGQNPPTMVGQDAVLHLISGDIYMSIRFTYWGGALGGFTYERSTPPIPEPSAATIFLTGLALVCGVKSRSRRRLETPTNSEAQNLTD